MGYVLSNYGPFLQSLWSIICTMITYTFISKHTFLRVLRLIAACIYTWFFWPDSRCVQFDSVFGQRLRVNMASILIVHLLWWTKKENVLAGTSILSFRSTIVERRFILRIRTHLEDHNVSGKWSVKKQSLHINLLEPGAKENALHRFRENVRQKQILLSIRTDSLSVVCCINRGRDLIVNRLSKGRQILKMTEWSLNHKTYIVQQIFSVFSILFATKENRKLAVFCYPL